NIAGHTHRDAVREYALDASVAVGAVRRERDGIESGQLTPVRWNTDLHQLAFEVGRAVRRRERNIVSNGGRHGPPGSGRGATVQNNDHLAASTAYRSEQRQDGRQDDLHHW